MHVCMSPVWPSLGWERLWVVTLKGRYINWYIGMHIRIHAQWLHTHKYVHKMYAIKLYVKWAISLLRITLLLITCKLSAVASLEGAGGRVRTAPGETSRGVTPTWQHHGTSRRIGRVDAFRPEGRGFGSRSIRIVRTFGKSFTCSCL